MSLSENYNKEIDDILNINPRIRHVYFLSANEISGFDKITGICAERITTNYEIALFLETEGYCVIDGKKFDIHRGDIRFLRPGQSIYSKKFGDFFSLHFSIGKNHNDFLDSIPTFMPSYNLKSFSNLLKELILADSGSSIKDALMLKYKMHKTLYTLHQTALNYEKNINLSSKSRNVIDAAIEYFESHIADNIGLNEISNAVNLHPVYFNRFFSKAIGIPPMNYLRKLRLNKAKELLLTTNLKVITIAKKCGFSSSSYFILQFKKEFSCTPAEFRAITNEDLSDLL